MCHFPGDCHPYIKKRPLRVHRFFIPKTRVLWLKLTVQLTAQLRCFNKMNFKRENSNETTQGTERSASTVNQTVDFISLLYYTQTAKRSFQYLCMLFSPDGTTPTLATVLTLSLIEVFLDDIMTVAELSFIPCSFPTAVEKENGFVKFQGTDISTNSNIYHFKPFEV